MNNINWDEWEEITYDEFMGGESKVESLAINFYNTKGEDFKYYWKKKETFPKIYELKNYVCHVHKKGYVMFNGAAIDDYKDICTMYEAFKLAKEIKENLEEGKWIN